MITGPICASFPGSIMNRQVLLLGKNGQVGRHLAALLGQKALAAGSSDIDFLKPLAAQLDAFAGEKSVAAVINAAAYTQVDLTETEGRQDAMRINAAAPGELAAWCKQRDIPLVHYSTDYVFDGSGQMPRKEDEPAAPLNAYGQSKLEGEWAIMQQGGKYLIFRTSWIYDAKGKNFLLTMLRLMKERETLNVVDDQIGAPTYAAHLARATIEGLERAMAMQPFPGGVYHLCNAGQVSWCGFAQAIFMLARQAESMEYEAGAEAGRPAIICQQIKPIPTSAYPAPAKRPGNSRLDIAKAQQVLGIVMPSWEQGLQECFEKIYAGSGLQAGRIKNNSA